MIRRLLCWLGDLLNHDWHEWYTLIKCKNPDKLSCWRKSCIRDRCHFYEDGSTVCLKCGKVKPRA
jgi:hypothetical protein